MMSQQPEAEHGEQHLAARRREAGLLAHPEGAHHCAPRLDQQDGEHQVDPARGRHCPVAVVPRERGEAGRRRPPCGGSARSTPTRMRDDDRHRSPLVSGRMTISASSTTIVASSTANIMPKW